MDQAVVTLDVRGALNRGQEPFSLIMQTVGKLNAGQQLRLISPFEPVPLYQVMAQRGFNYQANAREDGDWEILFSPTCEARADEPTPTGAPFCARRASGQGDQG